MINLVHNEMIKIVRKKRLFIILVIIADDLVFSEESGGRIKLLLTRLVKRWRILMSKYIALILSVSLIISGFSVRGEELITDNVHLIGQWQYILMELVLVWFVAVVVGTLTLMLSVKIFLLKK